MYNYVLMLDCGNRYCPLRHCKPVRTLVWQSVLFAFWGDTDSHVELRSPRNDAVGSLGCCSYLALLKMYNNINVYIRSK